MSTASNPQLAEVKSTCWTENLGDWSNSSNRDMCDRQTDTQKHRKYISMDIGYYNSERMCSIVGQLIGRKQFSITRKQLINLMKMRTENLMEWWTFPPIRCRLRLLRCIVLEDPCLIRILVMLVGTSCYYDCGFLKEVVCLIVVNHQCLLCQAGTPPFFSV